MAASRLGRSVVQFGKVMAKKGNVEVSYQEVNESGSQEDIRYVWWVKGQAEPASGHLLDFEQYIIVRDAQQSSSGQMPVIPGINVTRRLKWAIYDWMSTECCWLWYTHGLNPCDASFLWQAGRLPIFTSRSFFGVFLPQHPLRKASLTSVALAHFAFQEPLMFTCISRATEVKSVHAFWVRRPQGTGSGDPLVVAPYQHIYIYIYTYVWPPH